MIKDVKKENHVLIEKMNYSPADVLDKLYIFARAFTRLLNSHFLSSMTSADYHCHRIIYFLFFIKFLCSTH